MNHVESVALRIARNCVTFSTSQCSASRPWLLNLPSSLEKPAPPHSKGSRQSHISKQCRPFSYASRRSFCHSPGSRILKPYTTDKKEEKGLKFQDTELSDSQIRNIFGRHAPPTPYANRLLRVLHGRRIDGTLDLPLPNDVESYSGISYPRAIEDGLEYLRKRFPIDEDEAILHRLAREEDPREQDHPSVLAQRGQDIGLYKPHKASEEPYYGPQSGYYGAELSDKPDDPFGISVIDQIREANIAKQKKDEEDLQTHIDAEMAKAQKEHEEKLKKEKKKYEKSGTLAQRPENALGDAKQLRPPNSFERWVIAAQQRAQSKLTLDSPEISSMTMMQRLLPSFLLAAALCVGCYFFAQFWTRPKLADRLYPSISLSYATIGGIVALNLAIWVLWKLPPWWPFLNKYFIFIPAYPYAFSTLGAIFSHQSFKHLGLNMLSLGIFGLPLHEEIGRGNFIAIYLASGLVGGYVSFVRHVLQGRMVTSVLGASGSVFGILAAYMTLHLRDRFSLFFIPDTWQDSISLNGAIILAVIGVGEIIGMMRPIARVDHVDHFVGMLVGAAGAAFWQRKGDKSEGAERPTRLGSWWDSIFGK